MSHVQNLQHAVMAAKAGNPSLARVHLQKAAEESPDDPAVWLWMGWLSESPISMVRCLEAAIQDNRHHNIAQAGLAFARALNAYQVDPAASQTHSNVETQAISPSTETRGPIKLVEELAANVAEVQDDTIGTEDDWTGSEANDTSRAAAWDPNGQTPPPLPLEAFQSAQPQTSIPPTAAGAAQLTNGPASQAVPPPLSNETQAHVPESPLRAASQTSPQPASQSTDPGPAPVWRAASSDWFTVDSSAGSDAPGTPQPYEAPVSTSQTPAAPQETSSEPLDWAQLSGSGTGAPVQPDIPEFATEESGGASAPECSAAEQLDAELERRHVYVSDNPPHDSDQQQPSQPEATMPASPAVPSAEPWRPSGLDQQTPTPYESPVLPTGDLAPPDYGLSPAANGSVSNHESPTFEGEPLKPAAHPRTVLVVDDSPTVRKLVTMTLEKNGYRVVSSYDGVAAIREIAEHNPALILMDVNMPRMDGYQLCKLVRKHEATRHIPVLMLSGKDGVFDRLRGKMVGCSGYVPKPFVPEELVQAVGEQIGAVTR